MIAYIWVKQYIFKSFIFSTKSHFLVILMNALFTFILISSLFIIEMKQNLMSKQLVG